MTDTPDATKPPRGWHVTSIFYDNFDDDVPLHGEPPSKELVVPEWANRELRDEWNRSMLARRMWWVLVAAHRYRDRTWHWPSRRELLNLLKYKEFDSFHLNQTLDLMTQMGYDQYLFVKTNPRGRSTVSIGFDQYYTIERHHLGGHPVGVKRELGLHPRATFIDPRHAHHYLAKDEA